MPGTTESWTPERRAAWSKRMKKAWQRKRRKASKVKKDPLKRSWGNGGAPKPEPPPLAPTETYIDEDGNTVKKYPPRYARNASPSITAKSRARKEKPK